MENLPLDRLATYAIYDGPWHEPATYPGHPHRVFRLLLFRPWPHVVVLGPAILKTGVATHLQSNVYLPMQKSVFGGLLPFDEKGFGKCENNPFWSADCVKMQGENKGENVKMENI